MSASAASETSRLDCECESPGGLSDVVVVVVVTVGGGVGRNGAGLVLSSESEAPPGCPGHRLGGGGGLGLLVDPGSSDSVSGLLGVSADSAGRPGRT